MVTSWKRPRSGPRSRELPCCHDTLGDESCRGEGEHFRLGVDAEHAADLGGESLRQLTGTAAEIEQAVPGREPAEFGDIVDQPRGVSGPTGKVVPRSGAETARFKNRGLRWHAGDYTRRKGSAK